MNTITVETDPASPEGTLYVVDPQTGAVLSTIVGLRPLMPADLAPRAIPSDVDESVLDIRHDTPKDVVIAMTAHAAHRAYARSTGLVVPPTWYDLPGLVQASSIDSVRAIMSGEIKTPIDAHARWMSNRQDAGWTYAPDKSFRDKTHPNLVPFAQLGAAQRKKSRLFFAIATALLAAE